MPLRGILKKIKNPESIARCASVMAQIGIFYGVERCKMTKNSKEKRNESKSNYYIDSYQESLMNFYKL